MDGAGQRSLCLRTKNLHMNEPDFRDYPRLPIEQSENILATTDDVGTSAQDGDIGQRNASRTAMKNRFQENELSVPMTQALQVVYLARHGETAWTLSGQHT